MHFGNKFLVLLLFSWLALCFGFKFTRWSPIELTNTSRLSSCRPELVVHTIRFTRWSRVLYDLQNACRRGNFVDIRCNRSTPRLQSYSKKQVPPDNYFINYVVRFRYVREILSLQIPDSITSAVCSEAGFETSDPRM